MLDKFIYEDHLGRRFSGLENGVYLNYSELRDYSWSYDKLNDRITRFYRPITNRKMPLMVVGQTEEIAHTSMNRLLELAETDINARKPGKIYVGDYYTNAYITGSKKSKYLIEKRVCKIDLTITSDNPAWYREKQYTFLPGSGDNSALAGGVDYPFDYAHDYALALVGRRVVNEAIGSSAFRLLIYGEAVNPTVVIGGNLYGINGTVKRGETLLIDSLTKTITLTTAAGAKINWFDKRVRESYIFEPILAGSSIVSWLAVFGFDLTIIEERSEPRWI